LDTRTVTAVVNKMPGASEEVGIYKNIKNLKA
jgi:hypothetical protein